MNNIGRALGERVREKLIVKEEEYSTLSDYERFLLERGFEFCTEEDLKAGYDRHLKTAQGIALTEDEFITEAKGLFPNNYNTDTLKMVYASISRLIKQKKLGNGAFHSYAHYKWCLRNPDALIAYEREQGKWEVNNCDTEISEDTAKILLNSEWGFEVSRIKIIGQAYSESSDWQFIRFDCAMMTWLWKNGDLYQVIA